MKIVVIGAGASGLIASLNVNQNDEVILLERNDKVGKKILLTGNGKCNYWNENISLDKYNTDDVNNLSKILDKKEEVYNYLYNLGIYPKIKNGYYYPNSNQASSVQELLCKELNRKNVKIIYNCKSNDIEKVDNKFYIKTDNDTIECDKVIVAAGSKSYPKTGSDGTIFNILGKYHTINEIYPSLVPLKVKANFLKEWNNLRVDGKLSLYINDTFIKEESGEIQLTDYGISGIPTFNISSNVGKSLVKKDKVIVKIDFLPDVNIKELLENRNNSLKNHTIEELLETVLPYQLVFTLLKLSNINKDEKYTDIKNKELLIKNIKELSLEITDTLDFDRSQVSTGGVSLKEINPLTMESNNIKGLYVVGECLDVDGICGGFNLAFAFITGYLAGKGVSND